MPQRDLDTLDQQVQRLQSIVSERDFEMASIRKKLARTEQLLDSWRKTVQDQERELMDGETRLLEAELQVERLQNALVSIRSGRAYRLMRFLWHLRRPFSRTRR
jgi:chromosome segregation ATPase